MNFKDVKEVIEDVISVHISYAEKVVRIYTLKKGSASLVRKVPFEDVVIVHGNNNFSVYIGKDVSVVAEKGRMKVKILNDGRVFVG